VGPSMDIGPSEAETFWTEFLRKLARRGLGGVKLVISDAHEGINYVKCRKGGTVYYHMTVEAARDVDHKARCRVCGNAFKRREGNLIFKYFRQRHITKGHQRMNLQAAGGRAA
jgi:hypothetical protein